MPVCEILSCHAACQGYVTIHLRNSPLRTVHMKRINLNKVLFSSQSIHLILAGLIFNIIFFFWEFFSQFNISLKKKSKSRRGNCLVLPRASYGPVFNLPISSIIQRHFSAILVKRSIEKINSIPFLRNDINLPLIKSSQGLTND